jgi:hypothetical protein
MIDRLVALGVLQSVAQKAKDSGLDLPAIIKTAEQMGADFVNQHLSQWLGMDIK